MVEAEKRVYADRAFFLGDSDFYDVPIDILKKFSSLFWFGYVRIKIPFCCKYKLSLLATVDDSNSHKTKLAWEGYGLINEICFSSAIKLSRSSMIF